MLAGMLLLPGCNDTLFNPEDFESVLPFEQLNFSEIVPSAPTEYWELRWQLVDEPYRIVATGGTLEKDQLPESVQTAVDSMQVYEGFGTGCLPVYCRYYIVAVHENVTSTVASVDELHQFLGFIDSETEALLIVRANDFFWGTDKESGGIRRVSNGFEVVALKLVKGCLPVETDRFLLRVFFESGQVQRIDSEIWDYDPNGCI
jgi:hypothetical protein